MKTIIVVLAVIAVPVVIAESSNDEPHTDPIFNCRNKTGVTTEQTDKLFDGERIDNTALRAFTLCVFKEFDYMNDNGILQIDTLRKGFRREYSNENTEKIIKDCLKQQNTPEVTAYEATLCAYKKAKEF